jgi:hypothetical protein
LALNYLLVCPDFVSPHVRRVEILFVFVKDHAVDGGVVLVGVVLHVFFQTALVVDGKDVTVAGKIVERIAVDVVRQLVGGEYEDGTGLGVGVVGFRVASHGM